MTHATRHRCNVAMMVSDHPPVQAHLCDLSDHHDGIDHHCGHCGTWFRHSWAARVVIVTDDIWVFIRLRWDYVLQATVCRRFGHKANAMQSDGHAWISCSRCGHMEGTHPLLGEL